MRFPPRKNSREMKLLPFSKCPIYFKNQFNKEQNNFFLKAFVTLYFFLVWVPFTQAPLYTPRFLDAEYFPRQLFLTCFVSSINNTKLDFRLSHPAKNDLDRPKICNELNKLLIILNMEKKV